MDTDPKSIKNISDLQPNLKNHNKGTERGNYAIKESIQRLGAGRSGVADSKGRMIAGNATLQAIADLNIPVKIVQTKGDEWVVLQRVDLDLDLDKKAVELSYADNRTSQLNFDLDIPQFAADIEQELDLSFLYTEPEIKVILEDELFKQQQGDPLEGEHSSDEGKSQIETRVKPGEIWQVADQTLVCCDASHKNAWEKALKGRGNKPISLCFTSPPYASQRTYDESSGFKPIKPDDYVKWFMPFQENIKQYLADDGSFCINIKEHCEEGQRHLYVSDLKIAMVRQWGWRWIDELIWNKNGFPGHWDYRLRDDFERVFHFTLGSPKFFSDAISQKQNHSNAFWSKYSSKTQGQSASITEYKNKTLDQVLTGNVLKIPVETEQTGHPAIFPIALPEFFIKMLSEPGDLICDPFAGSSTTLVSSHMLLRTGIGFEFSTQYAEISLRRLEKISGDKARKVGEV